MTEDSRKRPTGKQPITRHPLFPVTVALWFGALFGLGSLAIRASLLESFVVSLGLDAVFTAMAPPLGATARILFALAMAALGGILGAYFARKVASPAEKKVKEKKAGKFGDLLARKARVEPVQRKRQLTVKEEPRRPDYGEHAPLPGTSPSILDVAEFELDELDDNEGSQTDAPEPDSNVDRDLAPAELPAQFAETAQEAEQDPLEPLTPESEETDAPFSGPAAPGNEAPVTLAENEQTESALPDSPARAEEEPAWPGVRKPAAFAPTEAEEPAIPEPQPSELPRFDIGRLQTTPAESIFNQKPVTLLFGAGSDDSPAKDAGSEIGQQAQGPVDASSDPQPPVDMSAPFGPPPGEPAGNEPAQQASEDSLQPAGDGSDSALPDRADAIDFAAQPVGEASQTETATAAERIVSSNLGDLSHVELLERLALSLERRRADQAAVEAAREAEPNAGEDALEDTAAEAPFVSTPAAIPAALKPIGMDDSEDEQLPTFVPPRHIGGGIHGDAAAPFATPELPEANEAASVETVQNLPRLASEPPQPEAEPESETADEEEDVLESGYSSLLELSRSGSNRQTFVRIEEPEHDSGEIEPVVIFPGQKPAADAPFARPADPPEADVASSDVPVAQDEKVATDPSAPPPFAPPQDIDEPFAAAQAGQASSKRDPEEAERALRAALATLQRMSGAA